MKKPSDDSQAIDLVALASQPIDNAERANRVWLPLGKRSSPRNPREKNSISEDFAPKVKRKELEKMAEASRIDKIGKLLDYYATTGVPVERMAEHIGLSEEECVAAMRKRGREA